MQNIQKHDLTVKAHKEKSKRSCIFSIITVSSSLFKKHGHHAQLQETEDLSGRKMEEHILRTGHRLSGYWLVGDDSALILEAVDEAIGSGADIVLLSGGTGLTSKDVTIETLAPRFSKEMPGFGELFRHKSIEQIGSAVILTRATAGIISGKAVFCLPGSPAAVELALLDIILPEAGHIVRHVGE